MRVNPEKQSIDRQLTCYFFNSMGTFVTLAEVLEARGSPLDEDEVWCLLLATTEALLDISRKGSTTLVFWFHLIVGGCNLYVVVFLGQH